MTIPNFQSHEWKNAIASVDALGSLHTTALEANDRHRNQPGADSQFEVELTTLDGSDVLKNAYSRGGQAIVLAYDHAEATYRTLSPPVLTFAPYTCARGVLESCERAVLLLNPEIDAVERATRCLNVWLEDTEQTLKLARQYRDSDGGAKLERDMLKRQNWLKGQAERHDISARFGQSPGRSLTGFGKGLRGRTLRIAAAFEDGDPVGIETDLLMLFRVVDAEP